MTLLAQAAVFLLAAVVAVPLCRRFKLSSVLGYLGAGVAIGPWGLGAIREVEATMEVAEFGVVLLLFVIGLELRPSRLRVMRRPVLRLGGTQVLVTTAVLAGLGLACGLPPAAAGITGFALSLSSTPLVLQLLAERGQLAGHQGRSAFAILLLQDVAAMPVLAVLPLLGAGAGGHDGWTALLGAGRGLGALALLVFGGRYALRPLLRLVAGTGMTEVLTAAALLVVAGTALIADAAGLSMALGAFVAGVLLADSEYRHELEADIEPFKGLLLGLFFMAVGASANLGLLIAEPLLVLGIVLGLIAVKGSLLFAIARATGHPPEVARGLAFALPQAGEFGFVLFSVGVASGALTPALAELLVIAVTLSMVLSPLLMIAQRYLVERWLAPAAPAEFDRIQDDESRVIIAGFGRFGQIVGRVLRVRGIPFTALDASAEQVDTVRRFGNKVYYGDASRLDLLEAAGGRRAEILVLALEDSEASVRTAELARRSFPNLRILARARNRQHALRLMEMGVHYLIRETYLSSLDLAEHVLEELGFARADAQQTVQRFRSHDEQTLREQLAFRDDEQKLMQTAQQAARELERLFQADAGETR